MNTLRLALCVSHLLACLVVAQDALTAADVIQQLAECVREGKAIDEKVSAATVEIRLKQETAHRAAREFGKPYDAKRVEELERLLKQRQESVARTMAELAAAGVKSPEERAAKLAAAKATAEEAQKAYRDASAPFREERTAARRGARAVGTALEELIEAMALMPKELGVADVQVGSNASDGFVSLSWRDKEDKQLVWAHLRLRPVDKNIHEQGKIDGKYPVHSLSDNSTWFWAGGVNVAFVVNKVEWQGKDKILDLVPKLLDIEALAALPRIEDAK